MPLSKEDIKEALRQSPEKIIALLVRNGYQIKHNWPAAWEKANADALTASKTMRLEILSTIKKEVPDIIEDGMTAEDFANRLGKLLRGEEIERVEFADLFGILERSRENKSTWPERWDHWIGNQNPEKIGAPIPKPVRPLYEDIVNALKQLDHDEDVLINGYEIWPFGRVDGHSKEELDKVTMFDPVPLKRKKRELDRIRNTRDAIYGGNDQFNPFGRHNVDYPFPPRKLTRATRHARWRQKLIDQGLYDYKTGGETKGKDWSHYANRRLGITEMEPKKVKPNLDIQSRLKKMYAFNNQDGRSRGEYEQHIAEVEEKPYWEYRHYRDQPNPRPEHQALDKTVFRADDPFWDTHYPPNGYNCKCWVVALTPEQFARKQGHGVELQSSDKKLKGVSRNLGRNKDGKMIKGTNTQFTHDYTDPQTGDERSINITPNAGFDLNPGTEKQWDKYPALNPYRPPSQKTYESYRRPPAIDVIPQTGGSVGLRTNIAFAETEIKNIGATFSIPESGWREVQTPYSLDNVIVNLDQILSVMKTPENAPMERTANLALQTLQSPYEVWITEQDKGKLRRVFINIYRTHGMIVQENLDGSLAWHKLSLAQIDDYRVGTLLYPNNRTN